ncbi:MAG: AsnC family transcriptional regulator [Lysobacteraceae bacterium]|nr:MAG: AsnC family transcriptional regulator [Xanthomonadaceae bacterium]
MDRIDFEILKRLRKNGRQSNKEIANALGIAPSTCLVRTENLRGTEALRGTHADIAPKAVGAEIEAMISVHLRQHTREEVASFRQHLMTLPEVVQLYHVAGSTDFLVHLWARDSSHLRELAIDQFTSRPEVARIETGLIFEHTDNYELPNLKVK